MKFTREHEYLRMDGDVGVVGITSYAQEQLGDIVFVELPEVGRSLTKGEQAAVVESVKAASEIYAPVSGTVIEVNPALGTDPSLVNSAPDGAGWMFKLQLADPAELDTLLDDNAYRELTA